MPDVAHKVYYFAIFNSSYTFKNDLGVDLEKWSIVEMDCLIAITSLPSILAKFRRKICK